MRGKAKEAANGIFDNRITPAYAGKRAGGVKWRLMSEDHPRLCGEKVSHSRHLHLHLGSPPPMRGKDENELKYRKPLRITPAYAGKSDRQINFVDICFRITPAYAGKRYLRSIQHSDR